MNLTVDIGNSQIKLAVFEKDELSELKKYPVLQDFKDTALLSDIKRIIADHSIQNTILSSVVDDTELIEKTLEANSRFIKLTHKTHLPVKNCYQSSTLGNDRVALAVGANSRYPDQNLLIIDAGTCITYDFVNDKNEYLGGSISPGLNMRFKALHNFTDALPLINVSEEAISKAGNLIGTNTEMSIVIGVLKGISGEMEGFINSYEKQFAPVKIILTGGDVYFFESYLKNKIFAIPNLVLLGLNKILDHNVSSSG